MASFPRACRQSETGGSVDAKDGIGCHLSEAQALGYSQTVEDVSLSIYPKPKPSGIAKPSKMYPYLLKGLSIIRPNPVWATDITYIRLTHGFVYLVAVMDWFSRYVLSWELSNSLDVCFCLSALERALTQSSPLIFNNDQGSQFTSDAFTARLEAVQIAISWDSRGRVFDNIFIERLWRSVKYEEVYLNNYDSVTTYLALIERLFQLLQSTVVSSIARLSNTARGVFPVSSGVYT